MLLFGTADHVGEEFHAPGPGCQTPVEIQHACFSEEHAWTQADSQESTSNMHALGSYALRPLTELI